MGRTLCHEEWSLRLRFFTDHSANIFSARFFPEANERLVCCAGDGQARVFDAEAQRLLHVFQVAYGDRAKKLAVERGNPWCFWVCAEDGCVRLYDLRAAGGEAPAEAGSSASGSPRSPAPSRQRRRGAVVVRSFVGTGLVSLSLATDRPEYLAVGGDCVWLLDRRRCSDSGTYGLVEEFMAPDEESEGVTAVCLDSTASRLAASYSQGHVHVFDTRGATAAAALLAPAAASEAARDPEELPGPRDGLEGGSEEELQSGSGEGLQSGSEEEPEEAPAPARNPARSGWAMSWARRWAAEERPKRPRLLGPSSGSAARCVGHLNARTVKDVQFLGPGQQFIGSGSDDGRLFVWRCPRQLPEEGRPHLSPVALAVRCDGCVVNCVVSHPKDCVLVVSGIDSDVKVLSPWPRAGGGNSASGEELERIVAENEARRSSGPARDGLLAFLRDAALAPGLAPGSPELSGSGDEGDSWP